MWFRSAVTLWLTLPLLGGAHAQIRGVTQKTAVRVVSESWTSTQSTPTSSVSNPTVIHAPLHWREFTQAQAATPTSPMQAPTLSSTASAQSLVGLSFPGPSDSIPPDSQIAAGPNQLVAVVNAEIAIYDKAGKSISSTSFADFYQSLVAPYGCVCYDSRIVYDEASGHFILSTDHAGPVTAGILLAVSQSSDPTGSWFKYQINQSSSSYFDFPTLGLSSSAIYIGALEIPNNTTTVHASEGLTVVGLPELLAGSNTLNVTRFTNLSPNGAIQGAHTYGNFAAEYLLESADQANVLHIYKINTSGTPTLTTTDVSVPPYKEAPARAAQPGGVIGLIDGPNDMLSAVWRNNSLWTAHTISSADGNSAVVRWYEIDTTTMTVKQSGEISGAGFASFPAITALADGEVFVVYTTSSATQFASAGWAHRDPSDPPGTMSSSGIYANGTTAYTGQRWGDYSGIAVDPNENVAWGIAEIALTSSSVSTAIAQLSSPRPADFSISSSPTSAMVQAGHPATYTVTATPQNGFASAISLSCTGLPAGASCAFQPPTITPAGEPVSSQLAISTAITAAFIRREMLHFAFVCLTLLPIMGLVCGQSRGSKRGWLFSVGMVATLLTAGLTISCGGTGQKLVTSNPPPAGVGGVAPGTYTITVVATSGLLQHSTTVSLTIQ